MHPSSPQPPRWAQRLLRWHCHPELLEEIQGDLYEAFLDRVAERGLRQARWYYVRDVLRFIRPFARESRRTPTPAAHRTELLTTHGYRLARYLLRHRGFLAINVAGLAVGIATCLVILHHVRFERSYDAYHRHADRLYRVSATLHTPESDERIAPTAYGIAPTLQEDFAEVEAAVRLVPTVAVVEDQQGTLFNEEMFFQADSVVFEVFTYPLLAGDPRRALVAPRSVVLSQTRAEKYFGRVAPASLIGTSLTINHQPHTITGVMRDVPRNSDLRPDALLSWQYDPAEWLEVNSYTFLLLRDRAAAETLQQKLSRFDERRVNPRIVQEWGDESVSLRHTLHPITELHYLTTLLGDTEDKGNKTYGYLFSLVAIAVLLVACINYVNLFVAQATQRVTEVGVRKAMGAGRFQLWMQYLGEGLMTTLLAVGLALVLVGLAGQHFADLLGEPISWRTLLSLNGAYVLFGTLALVSLLAGSYPALTLASVPPVRALRGGRLLPRRRGRLRQGLIVVQFTVAIIIMAGTLMVRQQVAYLRHKDLGFRQQQILSVRIPDDSAARAKAPLLQRTLQQDTRVAGATVGSRPDALWLLSSFSITVRGETRPMSAAGIHADRDYLEVLELPLVAGRNFIPTDSDSAKAGQVIVNEAFVREVGWDQAVGETLVFSDTDIKTVVGVVRDFHYAPLHEPIEPFVLFYDTRTPTNLLVHIAPQDIGLVRAAWQDVFPDFPLEYGFLDEAFEQRYRTERRMLTLFRYFSALSIFVACVGLLGLTALTVQQRMPEIGIRKVMGAGRWSIIYLLSRTFGSLLLWSSVVAMPLAYYAVRYWLQGFAYRTPIDGGVFLLAAAGIGLVALATISYHALRAAATNPVDTLRYE